MSAPVSRLRTALCSVILLATPVTAQIFVRDPDAALVLSCRADVRLFRSLRTGLVDYCRGHLRYAPGTLDCYQFLDEVCTVLLPGSPTFTETRREGTPSIFPCPLAPEPPVCPRMTFR
jgi:hypothetical protein